MLPPRTSPVFTHLWGLDINFYGELCLGGKSQRPPWFKAALIVFPGELQAFSPQPLKEQTNNHQTQLQKKIKEQKKKRESEIDSKDRSFQLQLVFLFSFFFVCLFLLPYRDQRVRKKLVAVHSFHPSTFPLPHISNTLISNRLKQHFLPSACSLSPSEKPSQLSLQALTHAHTRSCTYARYLLMAMCANHRSSCVKHEPNTHHSAEKGICR